VIPLRDDNPTALFPLVTLALIAANVCVWLYYQGAGSPEPMIASICQYGVIPADLTGAAPEPGTPMICPSNSLMWETLFTSMFLHGGWLHLIGNMWFLWIFGNNIEDSMGHVRFLLFYTLTGLVAGGAHVWFLPDSTIPTVGASGAISGVMGAYLILYPRVRVQTLLLIIIFVRIIPIPAWLILLYWFVLQIFLGAAQDVELLEPFVVPVVGQDARQQGDHQLGAAAGVLVPGDVQGDAVAHPDELHHRPVALVLEGGEHPLRSDDRRGQLGLPPHLAHLAGDAGHLEVHEDQRDEHGDGQGAEELGADGYPIHVRVPLLACGDRCLAGCRC
jgi:membrane associated rhomboid family serine protease